MDKLIKISVLLACTCFFVQCSNVPAKTAEIDYKKAEQYIRESEKQWAEAVASGDSTVIERILADDFIGVDTKGNQYNKAHEIYGTHEAPKYFKSNHLNDVKVRFYGNTAVAQGDETWVRFSGNSLPAVLFGQTPGYYEMINGKLLLPKI